GPYACEACGPGTSKASYSCVTSSWQCTPGEGAGRSSACTATGPGAHTGPLQQGLTDHKSRCMHACCGVEVQSKDMCTGDFVSAESSGQEFESCRPHQQVCWACQVHALAGAGVAAQAA